MSSENQIKCENCCQQVSEAVLILHQAYCERMMILCQICGVKYDKSATEEHDKMHEQKCEFCNTRIPKQEFDQHAEVCEEKPELCIYCKLQINQKDFMYHVERCGNRTEKCPLCDNPIRLSFMEEHMSVCQFQIEDNVQQFQQKVQKSTEKQVIDLGSESSESEVQEIQNSDTSFHAEQSDDEYEVVEKKKAKLQMPQRQKRQNLRNQNGRNQNYSSSEQEDAKRIESRRLRSNNERRTTSHNQIPNESQNTNNQLSRLRRNQN